MAVASRSTFGVAPGDGHENLRGWVDSMDGTFRLGKTTGPVTQRLYLRTTPRSFAQPRFAAASRTTRSKCGVAPRMTAPRQTIPSNLPVSATLRASPGISIAPGQR